MLNFTSLTVVFSLICLSAFRQLQLFNTLQQTAHAGILMDTSEAYKLIQLCAAKRRTIPGFASGTCNHS